MFVTRKLIAIGAVLAFAASGMAFAQTLPDQHQMGPDHQQMMQSGQHPRRSSPRLSRFSPTSTCWAWTAWSCWPRSRNGSPICRS